MANVESGDRFWLVWCNASDAHRMLHDLPSKQHAYEHHAEAEAKRLARLHPGHTFFVMRAESATKAIDVETKKLAEPPMPF